MQEKGFWDGAKAATPTVFGYISIGMALGIVGAKSGLTPLEIGLMSIIVYSGSGQFALCGLILAKASLPSIGLTIFLINLRHFLMNLHLNDFSKGKHRTAVTDWKFHDRRKLWYFTRGAYSS